MKRNPLAYYQRLSLGCGVLSGSFSFLFAYLYFLMFYMINIVSSKKKLSFKRKEESFTFFNRQDFLFVSFLWDSAVIQELPALSGV